RFIQPDIYERSVCGRTTVLIGHNERIDSWLCRSCKRILAGIAINSSRQPRISQYSRRICRLINGSETDTFTPKNCGVIRSNYNGSCERIRECKIDCGITSGNICNGYRIVACAETIKDTVAAILRIPYIRVSSSCTRDNNSNRTIFTSKAKRVCNNTVKNKR